MNVRTIAATATVAAFHAIAATGSAPAGFTHEMPQDTNMKPLCPNRAEMESTFRNPFGRVVTGTYWYWLSGNISCEGVVKDLEAMKRAGIERAYIGDIAHDGMKGPVRTLSPEWEKVMAKAFETASRLGMEIGIFNSPGWSMSGGPWIPPERAMRHFAMSAVRVRGPAKGVKLPMPKFESAPAADYRDVMAVAYPAPQGWGERLTVKDVNNSLLQANGPLVKIIESDKPFTAQSAKFDFIDGKIAGMVRISAEIDGTWKTVCEMPFTRTNHAKNVGFAPHAPIIASFRPVTARRFKAEVHPSGRYRSRFAAISICAEPLIARAPEKSLGKMFETPLPMWHEYQWPAEPAALPGSTLDASKAVALPGKVSPDGVLDWDVPAGDWVIYRIGAVPTGTKNCPANPEATGYEVDKTSREHVAFHCREYLGKILARTPPEHRKAIRYSVLDSYEQGGQSYTDGFAKRFKAAFGYDPAPYLPALAGMPAGERYDADRFLWDLRRFMADEVAYSFVGGLRKASNALGMKTWLECYGHWGFPGEFLQYGGQSDCVAGEYWSMGTLGDIENRAASSCGHIYGKREIWAESNTFGGTPFSLSPEDLKPRTDKFFAEGINACIMHLYIQQPDERKPGFTAWFGNDFNRHNTWFRQMDIFTGYLKRTGYLLQQGLNTADIAYFIGEDAPKMTGITDPAPPRGRQFDYINAEVLRETAAVDSAGRIVLPHGTKYEILVLPELDTMRPELLLRIEKLVNDGAFVIGPKPVRSPSLAGQPAADETVRTVADRLWGEVDGKFTLSRAAGKGTIAWNLPLEKALEMRGSRTDCAFPQGMPLVFSHREMPGKDIYFLSNQSGRPSAGAVEFRVSGRIPELWHAATGEIRQAPSWRATASGGTAVDLALAPYESIFVVFDKPANGATSRKAQREQSQTLALDWTMAFQSDPLHRGPAGRIACKRLEDLSKSKNPAIRYYSGPVVYKTSFMASKPAPGERITLKFGKVREIARVKVNGREAGGVWCEPYEIPVGHLLKNGSNTLEVKVCTSWANRLIGDASLPAKNRPTWMSIGSYGPHSKLKQAGLIGPVSLVRTAE